MITAATKGISKERIIEMNRKFLKKTAAAAIAALMAASLMTGCKNNNGNDNDTSDTSSSQTSGIGEMVTGTRPIEEGDDYAINKINPRSPEDSLPGGYTLYDYNEKDQGKIYVGNKSQIIIRAYNYNEDLQDMATWADSACANIKFSNVLMYARDTDFKAPEDVKICGFDGIRYDSEMKTYTQFDEEGNKLEEGSFTVLGRYYFFYSEQDAYVIMFECYPEDWDDQVAGFEEFIKDLEITKTSY